MLEEHLLKGIKYRSLQREEHFIAPTLHVNGGDATQNGLSYLAQWLVGDITSAKNSPIGLLCADGGIGKTTLARELCESVRVRHPKVVPLLIESDQWKNIANTGFSLDTLWDIAISRRLEHGNVLRSNPTALRVLLQEGLLVVIFDGFDELSSLSTDPNRPNEIIEELRELLTPEDEEVSAKIILTSRTTYWKSISASIENNDSIEVFRLTGFDNNQRKEYFSKRLSDPVKRDLALRLAKQVSGAIYADSSPNIAEGYNEDRVSGTPFILSLIAHFLEEDGDDALSPYDVDPLEPLLVGVCRRENIRQGLGIDPEKQLAIFEEIFRSSENEIHAKDVDFILQIYDISDPNIRAAFLNHFLLQRLQQDVFAARYEVLKVYFIARFLAKGLQKLYKSTPEKEIAQTLSQNSIGQGQVGDWLVWQLKRIPFDKMRAAILHAYQIIYLPINSSSKGRAAITLCHLVLQLISQKDKKDRTQALFNLTTTNHEVGSSSVRGLTLAGRLRSFDFSGISFENCTFDSVDFIGCRFTSATAFKNCSFEGTLDFNGCENESEITLIDSHISPDAEITLSRIKDKPASQSVRAKFAEEALARALKKFRSDSGFHGIQVRRRNSGENPRNPFNKSIWKALVRNNILGEHPISGVSEGGLHIVEDRDIRREVLQYIDNGIVGTNLRSVLQELLA